MEYFKLFVARGEDDLREFHSQSTQAWRGFDDGAQSPVQQGLAANRRENFVVVKAGSDAASRRGNDGCHCRLNHRKGRRRSL